MTTSDSASAWLEEFFSSYFKFRPVNATFIGMHDYDGKLPDYSSEGVAALRSDMEGLLDRSNKGLRTDGRVEKLDLLLARNFLIIQLEELESEHFHRGNPTIYSSEAIFGLISLCLRDYREREGRVASMLERMKILPALLKTGESNVRSAPKEWTNEAIKQCDGAIKFLGNGVKLLASEWGVSSASRLFENADRALRAFREYRDYLFGELLTRDRAAYACGTLFFSSLLRNGHCLEEMDGEKVANYGMERFSAKRYSPQRNTKVETRWKLGSHHRGPVGFAPFFSGRYHPILREVLGRLSQGCDRK